MEKNITIKIEVSTHSPLKADAKKEFIGHISQELSRYGVKNVEVKDFHYVDLRSTDAFQGFVAIIEAISPLVSIAASTLNLARSIRQKKEKSRIMIKREDGSFVELTDRMTEKEVNDALNIGRNEEEGSKTEN